MEFKNTQVWGFEHAIRGMRNPKNSWDKSDSCWCYDTDYDCDECPTLNNCPIGVTPYSSGYVIGENDMKLMQTLIKAGSEHRKFMRQIFISVDITAPDYWYKEFSTYKVGVVENSTSTMHKIMSKPFTADMFECKGMRGYKKEVKQKPNEIDEDTELWKRHPKYSNYIISNQGRVKHLTYVNTNNKTIKERLLCGSLHNDGYIFVSICLGNSQYKQIPKHRLVAETWIENPNNKSEINHKDGNKQNNSIDNLEWCTSSENQQHAVDNMLQPITVSTYKGKLSKEQRDEIINRYNIENISKRQLAKEYEVSHTTINDLLNNKYNYGDNVCNEYEDFLKTINELNELRDEYILTKNKEVWKTLIQKLPMNYLYTRTVTMNYENLLGMCWQRRFHKLTEWSEDFISWARTLPYSQELIFIDELQD